MAFLGMTPSDKTNIPADEIAGIIQGRSDFFNRIKEFNDFYKIDSNEVPTDLGDRLFKFSDILQEEMKEMNTLENGWGSEDLVVGAPVDKFLDDLTGLADLLGDIIVYCTSEMVRWGIPAKEVLEIIMDSNMSKAQPCGVCIPCETGIDGGVRINPTAILDDRGKVLKGPNYWKPEPKIRELLEQRMKDAT